MKKDLLFSRTTFSILVMILAAVFAYFDVNIGDQGELVTLLMAIAAGVSALYYRAVAKKSIGSIFGWRLTREPKNPVQDDDNDIGV